MLQKEKDTIWLYGRIRTWNYIGIVSSFNSMALHNRNWPCNRWSMLYVSKIEEGEKMTIVVKKVPKCFRGIVKFIFGVKNT